MTRKQSPMIRRPPVSLFPGEPVWPVELGADNQKIGGKTEIHVGKGSLEPTYNRRLSGREVDRRILPSGSKEVASGSGATRGGGCWGLGRDIK